MRATFYLVAVIAALAFVVIASGLFRSDPEPREGSASGTSGSVLMVEEPQSRPVADPVENPRAEKTLADAIDAQGTPVAGKGPIEDVESIPTREFAAPAEDSPEDVLARRRAAIKAEIAKLEAGIVTAGGSESRPPPMVQAYRVSGGAAPPPMPVAAPDEPGTPPEIIEAMKREPGSAQVEALEETLRRAREDGTPPELQRYMDAAQRPLLD
jgi:hypothetical protein